MSVTTKTAWNKLGYATDSNIQSVKQPWVQNAIAAGKTTVDFVQLDSLSASKVWIDQAAADEWSAFITDLASKNGYTVTVTTI